MGADLVILSHNINDLQASYFPGFTFDYSHKFTHPYYGLPEVRSLYSMPNILFQHFESYWLARQGFINILGKINPVDRPHMKTYGPLPPTLCPEIFTRNLKSFITLSRSNGLAVILFTQPLETDEDYYQRHLQGKPYNDLILWPPHQEFVNHHRIFNKLIVSTAEQTKVLVFDADQALGGKREYFFDVVHYTPAGVKRLAQALSDFIIANTSP